jgi:NADH dehydrogenase
MAARVGDVAACIAHALLDDATIGRRYELCGPKVYTLEELVRYVAATADHPRPVIALGPGLATLQARVMELLPGPLLTRDNIASMRVASVCNCPYPAVFGGQPRALESVVPGYLSAAAQTDPFAVYRQRRPR